MAQTDMLRQYLDAGIAFTQMTRARAEEIVKELVKAGEVQREQVQSQVDDLVERSRRNTDQLLTMVRNEVSSQFSQLGLATRDELRSLERRLSDRLGTGRSRLASATKTAARKASAVAPGAKKTAAKKTAAKKTAAKKSTAKKVAAKKATAKRAPAKKTTATPASSSGA